MTNVNVNDKSKTESTIKSKEELSWSDSFSLASFISNSATYVKSTSNTLSIQEVPSSSQETTLCKVCGDKSSGRHYGQMTCEGCKSFFKRSIRRKFDYTCRHNKQCKINMEHRNQCQSCRFLKCLKVGMKKDAVQGRRCLKYQSDNTESSRNSPSNPSIESSPWNQLTVPKQNISIKNVLDSILEAENAAPIVHTDDFYNQSLHILYSIVNWSKKLIYVNKISNADHLLLIQNCWCQLFILNYSMCGLTTKLFCNSNSSTQSFLSIQSQLLALSRLPLDVIEYGCLKAIIFFNPDTPLLFNSTLVDNAQESIQLALENHVFNLSSNKSRFGRILLRIPHLQRITTKHILEIFFNDPNETFEKSVNEMFHKLLSTSTPE